MAFVSDEAQTELSGDPITSAGDSDGDGYDDLIVSNYSADPVYQSEGTTYIFRGPLVGEIDVFFADATILGEAQNDCLGWSATNAGDADGDGRDDLLVGARGGDRYGSDSGTVALFTAPSGEYLLSEATARFYGREQYWSAGSSLASGADVTGDGIGDIVIGAYGADDSAGLIAVVPGGI